MINLTNAAIYFFPVPPNKPTIFDESGREVRDVIGPYLEGDTIVLKCIASGGEAPVV